MLISGLKVNNLVPRVSHLTALARLRGRLDERPWERGCGCSKILQVPFREIMESDAMWQFIEQVSGLNIGLSYLQKSNEIFW